MTTQPIIDIFTEGVTSHQLGDQPIVELHNGKDCFILNIPAEAEEKFKTNFNLAEDEQILMARDTSEWNTKKEGLVITDQQIAYLPAQKEGQAQYHLRHDSYIRVTYSADALLFWSNEENYISIPKNYFFKARLRSYDLDYAIKRLSKVLTRIASFMGGKFAPPTFSRINIHDSIMETKM